MPWRSDIRIGTQTRTTKDIDLGRAHDEADATETLSRLKGGILTTRASLRNPAPPGGAFMVSSQLGTVRAGAGSRSTAANSPLLPGRMTRQRWRALWPVGEFVESPVQTL